VITRQTGYLEVTTEPVPDATAHLHREGYVALRGVFDAGEVAELVAEVERVFAEYPPDVRVPDHSPDEWSMFRYEMFNRSAAAQRAIGTRAILDVVEPLLGEDCHVIANTVWWQPPEENRHGGRFWHMDAGPHVPRPLGVPWDERIPYPVFAVATHIMLQYCPLEAGPTGVIPRSHTSGQHVPLDRLADDDLEYDGRGALPLVANAGDVLMFVSDIWHRRLPTMDGDPGRMFIQCHYARRDIAQRLRTTYDCNQVTPEAAARATTKRDRQLIGLHAPFFYDR